MDQLTRPAWVTPELLPFTSRFIALNGHTIHYLDEGQGPTLLMLHGNPAWSFLYRHLIAKLSAHFRCVALDYPGFGLSTAAPGYDYEPSSHAEVVRAFVEQLDLRDYTPIVQDWGGPIGLFVAGRSPCRCRGARNLPPLGATARTSPFTTGALRFAATTRPATSQALPR